MMKTRLQSEQLTVQHVRYPGQRMPVARIRRGERPDDARLRDAGLDAEVGRDVLLIIVGYEAVTEHRPERGDGQYDEKGDDYEVGFPAEELIVQLQFLRERSSISSYAER